MHVEKTNPKWRYSNAANGAHVQRSAENGNDTREGAQPLNGNGVVLSNVTAKWAADQTYNTLDNINLTAEPGGLVAVIGSVGAGKVYFNYRYNQKKYNNRLNTNIYLVKRYNYRVRCYKRYLVNYRFATEPFPLVARFRTVPRTLGCFPDRFRKIFSSTRQWTNSDINKLAG